MTSINAWGSDDPVEETKGGTGTATFTTGDILYSDSANSLAKLAIGSSDEVLTVSGGVPAWAAATGGGGIVHLATQTASTSASLDFTSSIDSTYNVYLFILDEMQPDTNSVDVKMRTSTNGGVSFDASGDYDWGYSYYGPSISANGGFSGSNEFVLCGSNSSARVGTGTNEHYSGRVYLYNPSGTQLVKANWDGVLKNQGGSVCTMRGGGYNRNTADVDAVQFLMGSGNILAGTVRMYGMTTPS